MNIYAVLGGVALAVGLFFSGVTVGTKIERLDRVQERATELDRVIVHQQIVIKQVPKIVTRVVEKEVTVEKEVERVVTASNHMLAPDCVLPGDFGMLLVAAANGVDPTGSVDEIAGKYGCRETLAAILSDLRAGWVNSARLEGLQQYEKVVRPTEATGERSNEKASP
jgi:hypothetical protein